MYSRRLLPIIAGGLILAAVAAAQLHGYAFDAREPEGAEPFAWERFLPPPGAKGPDWQKKIAKGPLATFEALSESMVNNTITPDAVEAFRFLFGGALAERLEPELEALEGNQRGKAVERLYAALMRAPSVPDILLKKLRHRLGRAFHHMEEYPENSGRYVGWAISTNIHAALIAYRNTGDARFLDLAGKSLSRALTYRDSETGRVDPYRNRAMHGWGGEMYTEDKSYSTNITLAGRMAFVLALFAELAREDPQAHKYSARADTFVRAARLAMDDYASEFETDEVGDIGYYVRATHGRDIEPLNHMAWAGKALILLHRLTGEKSYGEMAAELARFFRSCMERSNGTVYWPYKPRDSACRGQGTEWVWKARITQQFIHYAWEQGIVFTDEDAAGVAAMILGNIFRPDGRVSARIDRKYRDMEGFADLGGYYLAITPFIVWEAVDDRIRERIEVMVASRPDIGGWMEGRHALEAYAYRLERE